jgi:predicted Zn-dependent peptidase
MNVEITRLSNGLTVITDPMPQLESAVIGVWVDAGARQETKPMMGVAHMLEHMAFKGTARRSARAIAEEIEAVGGFLNAYTSREQTAFHVRILKDDARLALDILSDILTNPAFEQGELERERQVVLQELGQARDTPDDIVFDNLQAVLYPNQPMGWPILGEDNTVSNFSRENLQDFMAANYRADGMAVIASGAVTHDAILKMSEDMFAGFRAGAVPAAEPARYVGGDSRSSDDLEQAHLTFAFPGVASTDPDFYIAQVYATALGGGMSSRLFQEVREKRGLCYSIYSFSQSFKDGGVIGIYAGTGEKEAAEIAPVLAGEMALMAQNASDAEIARAKAQLRAGLLMGLERPSTRAEQIAAQFFTYGRVLPVEELTSKLQAVDAACVRRFGARLMQTQHPAIAAVGPVGHLESYETFAARFGGASLRAAE